MVTEITKLHYQTLLYKKQKYMSKIFIENLIKIYLSFEFENKLGFLNGARDKRDQTKCGRLYRYKTLPLQSTRWCGFICMYRYEMLP